MSQYTTVRRSGRPAIALVMIASLLASAGARTWADKRREDANPREGVPSTATSLGGMNSYALGLLLGGLRGPLVMFLWSQSENQKTENDLEGLDTMIEWIRLLQPEFDTVHIFQIWNKAYNISVKMASKANKYDVILGALDYANKVDQSRPDDINIVAAIGQLYFDKLGNSSEKEYYRKRVREESLPHAVVKVNERDPSWRRMQLEPMLDSSFNILPELTRPKVGRPRPTNLSGDQEWDDGSDLQYLPQFEPYPDGVSPFGVAYNFYKRAEVLQNVEKQRHDQWSDMVIDSRPALSLKNWGEEELEQGHRRELLGFADLPVPVLVSNPEDPDELGMMTADVSLNQKVKDLHDLQSALAAFDHARRLLPACLAEYDRHLRLYPDPTVQNQVQGYVHEVRAEIQLANADYEFLSAIIGPASQRDAHLIAARKYYLELRRQAYADMLKYYTPLQVLAQVLPPGYSNDKTTDRKPIEDLPLDDGSAALKKADAMVEEIKKKTGRNPIDTDRAEYDRFVGRSMYREKDIADSSYQPGK